MSRITNSIGTSAKRPVEIDKGQIFVEQSVVHANLGTEVATLGIEYIYIIQTAAHVLQTCQTYIFAGGGHKFLLHASILAVFLKGCDGSVYFGERRDNRLLVGVAALIVGGDCCLILALIASEIQYCTGN